ncbi:MAG: GNAT family N-acetyltransferase [Betaproteobacteria bacterium]
MPPPTVSPPIAIRAAASASDVAQVRTLFVEYAATLSIDLRYQGFAEELATLPGAYAAPRGMLLLAGPADAAIGCVALRPLVGTRLNEHATLAEIKRLYVRPEARGTGLGRRLMESVVTGARAIGYRELKLDTLEQMREAQLLYGKFGFRECAPYYDSPITGTVYMSLTL